MRLVALSMLSVVVVSAGQPSPTEPNPYARGFAPVLAPDIPAIGIAAFKNDLPNLRYLISSGTNIESAGRDKRAPLLLASAGGHVEAVTILLRAGANINARDSSGSTALHWAAERGAEKVALLLLSHHAQVNIQDQFGGTPLIFAAMIGDKTVVKALIRAGARRDFIDVYGWTANEWARRNNYADVVSLLESPP